MAGGLFGFMLAGAAEGAGTSIKEQGVAKREAALEELRNSRLMQREDKQRDFTASQAEIQRQFDAEQKDLDRASAMGIATEKAKADAGAKSFDRERDTRKDYGAEPDVKTYQDVRNAYERVRASAETDSGPGDIGLIFNFMKMLDPGSVVREGEFATAQNAGGVAERVRNLYNSLLEGERLSPSMRGQFVSAADKLYGETSQNLDAVNERYGKIATDWNIDSSRVLIQPEQYEPLKLGETREYDGKIKVKRIAD